ncbi:hypothetical protein BGW41_001634 [Actinomortierella wolfii]|nr:hypothetical protein BGW41_001634 [Actinomortierella wolfii]
MTCQCIRYLTDTASASVRPADPCQSSSPSPTSRIELLPLWEDESSPTADNLTRGNDIDPSFLYNILGITTLSPVHPTLRYLQSNGVHFYSSSDNAKISPQWRLPKDQVQQTILSVLTDPAAELQRQDYIYILAVMDQSMSTQQQFWRFLSHFVRSTITKENDNTGFWKIALGKYITPIYRAHGRHVFVQQLARLDEEKSPQNREDDVVVDGHMREEGKEKPLLTDQYILGKLMVELLVYPTNDGKEAAMLFEALSEQGQIRFHKDVFGLLVKRATLSYDASQISLLGAIMLRHEALFLQNKVPNRPLLIYRTYMDNFLLKACELGLETLARDVFRASLAAGRCQRASSFNIILNSYSTKQFGSVMFPSTTRRSRHQRTSSTNSDRRSSYSSSNSNILTMQERLAALRHGKLGSHLTITSLEKVDELVHEMEMRGVVPDMGTLNILVKLYLEVEMQGVHESRPWQDAFTRYNPANLEPDTVTCNTLLAFYERKRDLTMMRTIYDSMTTADVVGSVVAKTRKQRRKEARELDQQPHQEQGQMAADTETVSTSIKSRRDVYTYNTMLHALLHHAKEPKDVAAIGQVFYDMEQDGVPADTVTFNTNIMFHIRRGDFVAAMQVYQDMLEAEPTAKTESGELVATLGSLEDRGRSRQRTIRRSLPTWASLSSSSTETSEGSFKETATTSDPSSTLSIPRPRRASSTPTPIPPTRDAVTYTTLMSGYGQSNQMEIATFFFSEMVRLGLEPNFKTYSTLVSGLERAGDYQRAQTLWDMVLKDGQLTAKERKLVEALRMANKQ